MAESREGFEIEAARVSSGEVRSMPMGSADAGEAAAGYARPGVSRSDQDRAGAGPVPGRLVLQDEGAGWVILDSYATGRREPLASIAVGRDVLAGYALELLRASLRPTTTVAAAGTAEKKGAPQRRP